MHTQNEGIEAGGGTEGGGEPAPPYVQEGILP